MNYGVTRQNLTNIEKYFGKKVTVGETLGIRGYKRYLKNHIEYNFQRYRKEVELTCQLTGWRIVLVDHEHGDGIKEIIYNDGISYEMTDERKKEIQHAKCEMLRLFDTFFTGVEGEHPLSFVDRKSWDYNQYWDYYDNGHLRLAAKYMLEDDILRGIDSVVNRFIRIQNKVWCRNDTINSNYIKYLSENHSDVYKTVLKKIENKKLEKQKKKEQKEKEYQDYLAEKKAYRDWINSPEYANAKWEEERSEINKKETAEAKYWANFWG